VPDKENVNNRAAHAWSLFAEHPELGFINVEWLEHYRERWVNIVQKRIDEAAEAGNMIKGLQKIREIPGRRQ
jgi:hypothetical protein